MHRFTAIAVCAALASSIVALAPAARAETKMFHATLTAAQEVPPTTSKGQGTADLTLDTASKKLTWKVTYSGLTGPATAAHIHGPAAAGANAGVAVNLAPSGVKNPIEGSATLTDAQIADLETGKDYINIHTADNKGGEIRGQIAP